MPKRSIVYIDGFNLYYGALKGTPWKWLDLQRYFETLRSDDEIVEIAYFTALVHGPSATRARQETYLSALGELAKVDIIYGKYRPKTVRCTVVCPYDGNRSFTVQEEKQTDVAIGVRMMDDAYRDRCDRLIIVSGDGDMVPAIRMVRDRFPEKTTHVYIPARNKKRAAARDVRDAAHKARTLPAPLIEKCQLPAEITATSGATISKPTQW